MFKHGQLQRRIHIKLHAATRTYHVVYRVIHQSPDASNHRTPSKCRTTLPVIPTSIHLRLSLAESAFTATRNGHQLHQGFVCRARQAGHLRVSSSRCFFQALRSANPSLQYVHVFWYQIRVSKRLIPSSPSLAIYFADSQHDSRDV